MPATWLSVSPLLVFALSFLVGSLLNPLVQGINTIHTWGRRVLNGYFFWLVNFSYDMKHANVERYVANAKRGHNDVPHIFWSLYEYLFPLLKWRFSSSLNGHIVPIPFFTLAHAIMFTIEPRVVNVFLVCSLIFFWTHVFKAFVLKVTPTHTPLKTYVLD